MYNIPNIKAYIPDAILNNIGSFLLHLIDNDSASKFVTNSASKNINKNDFIIQQDKLSKNFPVKLVSLIKYNVYYFIKKD